ncbi:BZ3500_MvSof-1268-A1-R1_C065g00317 [Microbotryum saponariae]|uniref:BZ3500_MvSof-1268-A1-R1_C065g00317 protein n=1 Tax=Microbotryum saponariae TaxID=289078 RepID=A0A2X0KJF1_9BASI|nr:BZ3500_MvSof-1268-A1-R1_C065g00317 [Microbotryum saponariae]
MPAPSLQPTSFIDPSQMPIRSFGPQWRVPRSDVSTAKPGPDRSCRRPIPWALTKDEKKRYDQIFRAWDQQGTGFIEGRVSKEVFGQAGLDQNDLMSIWNLADVQDRGKLNIDEFHVAMGLIYRQMAPPSARDLDDSVGFLTNLLKNDNNQRSTNQDFDGGRGSMAKARSLHDTALGATVRMRPSSATTTTKRARCTSRVLAISTETRSGVAVRRIRHHRISMTSRIACERLERSTTPAKDDERRKLERELLRLEHEELPELERRIKEKVRDKKRDQRKYALERDSRNNDLDRYGDRDRYSTRKIPTSRGRHPVASPERGYNRGTYDNGDGREKPSLIDSRKTRPKLLPKQPSDEDLKAKELERQAKLEREKLRGIVIEQSINSQNEAAVEQVREEVNAAAPEPMIAKAANEQLDVEEDALARREAQLKREKEERMARIKQLEQEAQEAEENYARSKAMFAPKIAKVAPPPPALELDPLPTFSNCTSLCVGNQTCSRR